MVSELLLKGTHNGVFCEMYAVLYVLSCTTIIIEDQCIDHLDHNDVRYFLTTPLLKC